MKWTIWVPGLLFALGLAACGRAAGSTSLVPYPALNPAQVALGRDAYVRNCASCHGANAEGAPNWATPGPDGLHPAPAHDDSGHTWHHPDRVLYETIRDGMSDPLHPGAPLRMPAFGGTLSDSEVQALIAYFKSLWSDERRLWQWNETVKDLGPTSSPP